MKRFFMFLLIVCLIICGGVGGYIFRGTINEKSFDIAIAQNTIKTIAEKANFVSSDTTTVATTAPTSHYSDYEETVVDYNGKEAFIKTFVSLLYYAVDGDVNASTHYISHAKYQVGMTEVEGVMSFYIKLTSNQAVFYIKDLKNNIVMVMEVSSENNTVDHYQIDGYMAGSFSAQPGLVYFTLCANNEKLTRFAYSEVEWSGEVYSEKDITNETVYQITVFDFDLSSQRIMNKTNDNLTEAERVDFATRTMKEFYQVEFIDEVYKSFVETDFLAKAYKNLGHNVVD